MMLEELKRWKEADDAIYFMSIQEQAEYADYVTVVTLLSQGGFAHKKNV